MKEYTELGDEILYKNVKLSEACATILAEVHFFAVNCYAIEHGGATSFYGDVIAVSSEDFTFPGLSEKYTDCTIAVMTGDTLWTKQERDGLY